RGRETRPLGAGTRARAAGPSRAGDGRSSRGDRGAERGDRAARGLARGVLSPRRGARGSQTPGGTRCLSALPRGRSRGALRRPCHARLEVSRRPLELKEAMTYGRTSRMLLALTLLAGAPALGCGGDASAPSQGADAPSQGFAQSTGAEAEAVPAEDDGMVVEGTLGTLPESDVRAGIENNFAGIARC